MLKKLLPNDASRKEEMLYSKYLNYIGNSAVLVSIYDNSIILTKRSLLLRSFRGQVCLPGGRFDENDLNYTNTALREFSEEIEFSGTIQPLMCMLPKFSPTAEHKIYPIIARLNGKLNGYSPAEVAKVILLKINDLNPDLFAINTQMPHIDHNWCFTYEGEFVWGLTASILKDFCQYKEIL